VVDAGRSPVTVKEEESCGFSFIGVRSSEQEIEIF
jgi:hypothetical protein